VNNPQSGTVRLNFSRFGLLARLLTAVAILAVETVLISGLIQSPLLDSLTGAARVSGESFRLGLLGAAPFVIWCGQTLSVQSLIISLTLWGFFKGLYDANIFAAMLDTVPPKARGTAVGFMNMTGWLVGAGSAPVLIGYIAGQSSLSFAISIAAIALVIGSALLLTAILVTVNRDIEKVRLQRLSE